MLPTKHATSFYCFYLLLFAIFPEANCQPQQQQQQKIVSLKLLTNVRLKPPGGHFLVRLYARHPWEEMAKKTLIPLSAPFALPSAEGHGNNERKRQRTEDESSILAIEPIEDAEVGEDVSHLGAFPPATFMEYPQVFTARPTEFPPGFSPRKTMPLLTGVLEETQHKLETDKTAVRKTAVANESKPGDGSSKSVDKQLKIRHPPPMAGVLLPLHQLHENKDLWLLAEKRIGLEDEKMVHFEVTKDAGNQFMVEIQLVQPHSKNAPKNGSRKVAKYTQLYDHFNSNAQPIDYKPGTLTKCFLDQKGIVACFRVPFKPELLTRPDLLTRPELLFHLKLRKAPYLEFSNFVHRFELSCAQKFEGRRKTSAVGGGGANWSLSAHNRMGEMDTRIVASSLLHCPENRYNIRIRAERIVLPSVAGNKRQENIMMDKSQSEHLIEQISTLVQCPPPKVQELTEYRINLIWTKDDEKVKKVAKGKEGYVDKTSRKMLDEQKSFLQATCDFYDWEEFDAKDEELLKKEWQKGDEKVAPKDANANANGNAKGKNIASDAEMEPAEPNAFPDYAQDEEQEAIMILDALHKSNETNWKSGINMDTLGEAASHLTAAGAGSSRATELASGTAGSSGGNGRNNDEQQMGEVNGGGSNAAGGNEGRRVAEEIGGSKAADMEVGNAGIKGSERAAAAGEGRGRGRKVKATEEAELSRGSQTKKGKTVEEKKGEVVETRRSHRERKAISYYREGDEE